MTPDEQLFQEIHDLAMAYQAGQLTETQRQRLETLILRNPQAADVYLRYTADSVTFRLLAHSQEKLVYGDSPSLQKPSSSRANFTSWVALAAAVTTVASILTAYVVQPGSELPATSPGDSSGIAVPAQEGAVRGDTLMLDDSRAIAVLAQTSEAVWEVPSTGPRVGSALRPGLLRLRSGLVQIEFYSGASVVLEGPAEFELMTPLRGFARRGKVRAQVPSQAHGFTIGVPGMDVVDLGTEFGVAVDESGETELHVISGEVKLEEKNGVETAPRSLTMGQGLRRAADGQMEPIPRGELSFVSPVQLSALTTQTLRDRQAKWVEFSRTLRQDPSLILYYTFEGQEAWDRVVHNQAVSRLPGTEGALVGAQWSEGRWPEKRAIEFKRTTDRLRLDIPGEYAAVTFSAWVRFDGFDQRLTALLLTDAWDAGVLHWQVNTVGGALRLGVRHERGYNDYDSPSETFGWPDLGRWMHLATVYDAVAGSITHYVDGQARAPIIVSGTGTARTLTPRRFGPAEIGNWALWGHPPSSHPTRNLNGRIDEFALFGRALDAAEIHNMYEVGKPRS